MKKVKIIFMGILPVILMGSNNCNMHAKVKTMQKETSTMTRRTSRRQHDSKKICKNLKAGD